MNKSIATFVLSAVAIGCTACASVDGGGVSWNEPASLPAATSVAEWKFTPHPVNDDEGYPMPPVSLER